MTLLVLLSAWLGWSATATVNGIHINAAAFLSAAGQPVPPNPELAMRRPPHALLAAFAIWLILVLIAPQIGDTLDPDNQVAGGVFAQLPSPSPIRSRSCNNLPLSRPCGPGSRRWRCFCPSNPTD